MTDAARAVVVDYLLLSGWTPSAEGPAGELWTRGSAEAVVPRTLDAGTAPWNRLALALAREDGEPVEDVLVRWRDLLIGAFAATTSPSPRPRSHPGRVELDAHLDGITVREHETSAYNFGRFVMRTADSVKELVKSSRGIRHHARELLVAGGPGEGSVRVTFREPDRSDDTALFTEPPETAEGQALVFLAGVFAAAETTADAVDADELRSHLAPLDARARQSVARVADTLIDGGWILSGMIRRGSEEAPVRLGLHAAQILSTASREGFEEERSELVSGTLDGWVWSTSELTLITDDRGTIRVSVPMPLQARVAELHVERDTRVRAQLNIYSRLAAGTRDTMRTTYSLAAIDAEQQTTLPD